MELESQSEEDIGQNKREIGLKEILINGLPVYAHTEWIAPTRYAYY